MRHACLVCWEDLSAIGPDYQKYDAGVVVTSLFYAYLRYSGKEMRRNKPRKASDKPAAISEELLEKLAECVHKAWKESREREGWTWGGKVDSDTKTTPLLVPYSELSEKEKNYDRHTVKAAITAIKNAGEGTKEEKVIIGIGEAIHIAWAEGRLREGWVYGQKKDSVAKTTPCLVPFKELPEEEKEYDLLIARRVLKIFHEECEN
jgi:hypothetical protein